MAYHNPGMMGGGAGAPHLRPHVVDVAPDSSEDDSYYYDEDEISMSSSTGSTQSYTSSIYTDSVLFREDDSWDGWDGVRGAVTLQYDFEQDRRTRFAHNVMAGPSLLLCRPILWGEKRWRAKHEAEKAKRRNSKSKRKTVHVSSMSAMSGAGGGPAGPGPYRAGQQGVPPQPNIRPVGAQPAFQQLPQTPLVTTTRDGLNLPRRKMPPADPIWGTTGATGSVPYRAVPPRFSGYR